MIPEGEKYRNWAVSSFPCPICKRFLVKKETEHGLQIWCPHYACPSVGANEGATGKNETLAYNILIEKLKL